VNATFVLTAPRTPPTFWYGSGEGYLAVRSLAREGSVLVDERKDAGLYEVNLHASGLSGGMCFCRARAEDFVQIRKLLLVG